MANKYLPIPVNLNLQEILNSNEQITPLRRISSRGRRRYEKKPIKLKNLTKHLGYFNYIVGTIVRREQNHETPGSWVNLTKAYLEEITPKPTLTLVLSTLQALDIIEVNTKYKHVKKPQKSFSKSYRLTERYRNQAAVLVPLGPKVSSKIEKAFGKRADNRLNDPNYSEYRFQKDRLMNRLNVDSSGALAYAATLFKQGKITEGKHSGMIQKIQLQRFRDYHVTIDKTVNRLFSWVEGLDRELKPFIQDSKGDPLVSIDFRSSHAFHLWNELKGFLHMEKKPPPPPYVGTILEDETNKLAEILRCEGGIYKYVIDEFQKRYQISISRDSVKDLWNQTFLNTKTHKYKNLVRSLFPAITDFIDTNGRDKLCIKLMKSESKLVHNHIIRRISQTRGLGHDCILFAIHDALLVDKDHANEIESIMLDESRRYFSLPDDFDQKFLLKTAQLVRPAFPVDLSPKQNSLIPILSTINFENQWQRI